MSIMKERKAMRYSEGRYLREKKETRLKKKMVGKFKRWAQWKKAMASEEGRYLRDKNKRLNEKW